MQTQVGALETGAVEDKIEIKSTQSSMSDKERRHLSWAQARKMPCNLLRVDFIIPPHIPAYLLCVKSFSQCRSLNH